MSWHRLKAAFVDNSDALEVHGRRTSGLMGLRRTEPQVARLSVGDELRIRVRPDEPGHLLLLVEIEAAGQTVCLVPRAAQDARHIAGGGEDAEVDEGFEFPEESDQGIVLTEPLGPHTVFAAVTSEPLPEALRARLAREGGLGGAELDELAAALAAMPDKEMHRRTFIVHDAAAGPGRS